MTTKCNPYMSEGEARGIAFWAARDAGLNTDDVTNIRRSPDGCTVYFEEWNPFPWTNTDHSVHLQNNDWKVRTERYYVFGDGVPPAGCGGSPTGSEYVTEDMMAMLDNEYSEGVEEAKIEGCIDSDSGISPDTYGTVSFVSKDGIKDIYDVCKTPQLLVEADCGDYAGPDTVETMLTSFIFCKCVNGKCVNEPLDVCHDPLPEDPPEGGTVWSWSQGNVVLDYCADDDSIRHITCDEDGIEKQDITPCPEELDCVNGLCGGIGCYDTDPENDPFKKGTTTYVFPSGYMVQADDSCASIYEVNESYCPPIMTEQDFNTSKEVDCPDKFECHDGVCIPALVCKNDSDPTNDPTVAGYLEMFDPETGEYKGNKYDACGSSSDIDSLTMIDDLSAEFSCMNGMVLMEKVKCPTEQPYCVDMRCVELIDIYCEDFPDWHKSILYGLVTGNSDYTVVKKCTDFCLDNNHLNDCSCDETGTALSYVESECPENYLCIDSKCRTCSDSDPSNDPKALGYVMDVQGTNHSDYCVGDKLVQVNCNAQGEVDATEAMPCDSGTCKEGVCK